MRDRKTFAVFALVAVCGAGCSSMKPVLYPNPYYQRVGAAQAQQDTEACLAQARSFVGTSGRSGDAARTAGKGAVMGGATGAVGGAVGGAITGSAGTGAAVGAAGGAAAGLIGGLFHSMGSRTPEPAFAGFVDRCLREKGYEPVGWK